MTQFDPTIPSTPEPGARREPDAHSLSGGADGPLLLHDVALVEKLARFDRERVPERSPHAKGSGAFGELEITEDVSMYTKADLFQKGRKTPTCTASPPSPVSSVRPIPGATCAASR